MDEGKLIDWIDEKKNEYMALFMDGKEEQTVNDENRIHMSRWLLLDELSQKIEKGTFK